MNIGILINSHKKNATSLSRTLESINHPNKLVVVAGSDFNSTFRRQNSQFIQVTQNISYFTGLVEIISNPIFIESWTHVLTISDDMELGKNTLELCQFADPDADATAATPEAISNLVLYKKEYLFSIKNIILQQKDFYKNNMQQPDGLLYKLAICKNVFNAGTLLKLETGTEEKKQYFPALQVTQYIKNGSLATVDMDKIFECYNNRDQFFYDWSIKKPEAEILFNCVRQINAKKIVVVGVFKGVSTKVILQAIGDRDFDYIINIDPFFENYCDCKSYYNDFMNAMKDVYNGQIIVLKGFASKLGREARELTKDDITKIPEYRLAEINQEIDLCFIDGDHYLETCLEDFKAIWKKIRKRGIVLLHDVTNQGWKIELQGLLDYIKTLPDAKLNVFYGIDGMGIVEKI